MPDAAFEKLAALVGTWDQVFQCAVFLVAVVALAAVATHAVTALGRAFESAVGLVRSAVTVPIGVFWGWEADGNHTPTPVQVTCKCECKCDADDDDGDDEEPEDNE